MKEFRYNTNKSIYKKILNYKNLFKAIPIQLTSIRAYSIIDSDGTRYLLGDDKGYLYVLALQHNTIDVLNLELETIGETSCPSTLSYIDGGVVFVGSSFGDSQLIQLQTEANEDGELFEVVENYPNLGPIVDFCVVDRDGQGQGQVVACCGVQKDGSIRVIRNGIGINEQAVVELPGIKGEIFFSFFEREREYIIGATRKVMQNQI